MQIMFEQTIGIVGIQCQGSLLYLTHANLKSNSPEVNRDFGTTQKHVSESDVAIHSASGFFIFSSRKTLA